MRVTIIFAPLDDLSTIPSVLEFCLTNDERPSAVFKPEARRLEYSTTDTPCEVMVRWESEGFFPEDFPMFAFSADTVEVSAKEDPAY